MMSSTNTNPASDELPDPIDESADEHIFISYSRQDNFAVNQLVKEINQLGYPIWFDKGIDDRGLRGGEKWKQGLAEAINRAAVIILAVSPDALTSKWVMAEIHLALKLEKPLIPFHIRKLNEHSGRIEQQIGIDELNRIDATTGDNEVALQELRYALEHSFRLVNLYTSVLTTTGEQQTDAICNLINIANQQTQALHLLEKLLTTDELTILQAVLSQMKVYKFNIALPTSFYASLKRLTYNPDIIIADWAATVMRINVEEKASS